MIANDVFGYSEEAPRITKECLADYSYLDSRITVCTLTYHDVQYYRRRKFYHIQFSISTLLVDENRGMSKLLSKKLD